MKSKILVLSVLAMFFLSAASVMSVHNLSAVAISNSSTVSWNQLHGVSYRWWPFQSGNQRNPSIQFPEMASSGFNFVRIPLGWTETPPSWLSGSNNVTSLATAADANGLHVVYSFYQDQGVLFPPEVMAVYPGGSSAGNTPYYLDQVTVDGVDLWTYQFDNYWKPLITEVDSHPSTIGYEILNEPKSSSCGNSCLQSYHTWFAEHIRTLTSKTIIFGSYGYDTKPSKAIAPPSSVGNLAIDVHVYNSPYNPTTLFAGYQSLAAANNWKVELGEFGPCSANVCSSLSTNYVSGFVNNYVKAAYENGFAQAYWIWDCQTDGFPPNDVALLGNTTSTSCDTNPQPNQLEKILSSTDSLYYSGSEVYSSATTNSNSNNSFSWKTVESNYLLWVISVPLVLFAIMILFRERERTK